jgi:TRAP-type C4-dicarboxylate transport system permease small subunit
MAVLAGAVLAVSAVCLVLMVLIISWQVFSRFFLNTTPFWSEEGALMLMIYFGMFGAVAAYRERLHIGVIYFIQKAPARVYKLITFGTDCLIASFGVFMLVWGISLVQNMMNQTMPATQIKVGYSYLPIPIAGAVLILFALEKIIQPLLPSSQPSES